MTDYADLEVVVHDNFSDENTRRVVESIADSRIVYRRTSELLPMSDNWELALEACSGEYITYVGDDDAMLPDACGIAERVLNHFGAKVASWNPHNYWWPNAITPWNRNRLYINLYKDEQHFARIPSHSVLEAIYKDTGAYGHAPMIYQAFVHRSVIEEAKKRYGNYFGLIPDVHSGIVNLWLTENFVQCKRALSVRGISGHSIGTSHVFRSKSTKQSGGFSSENQGAQKKIHHPLLFPSDNINITIANAALMAKETLFPNEQRFNVDIGQVITAMARNINRDPGSYDTTLQEMRQLAERHGIDLGAIQIPPKMETEVEMVGGHGPSWGGDGQVMTLAINGDDLGLQTIADAVKTVMAIQRPLMPRPGKK